MSSPISVAENAGEMLEKEIIIIATRKIEICLFIVLI
jgi:hypothetical protein